MARRKLIWARMAPAMTTLVTINNGIGGAIESQDLLQTFRTQAGLTRGPVGLTVMRIRMGLYFYANSAEAPGLATGTPLFFGIRKRSFDIATLEEATEQPPWGPQLSPHDDWMAWGMLPPKQWFRDDTGSINGAAGWSDVDVRSMRKLDELDETLQLVVQGTAGSNTIGQPAYLLGVSTSVLVALP